MNDSTSSMHAPSDLFDLYAFFIPLSPFLSLLGIFSDTHWTGTLYPRTSTFAPILTYQLSTLTASRLTIIPRTSTFSPILTYLLPTLTASRLIIVPRTSTSTFALPASYFDRISPYQCTKNDSTPCMRHLIYLTCMLFLFLYLPFCPY
jgi:hypothetical protein